MAQAISNKVLVQSSKYCWMICDYSMSGSTLSYTLSFKFEGGCAQLDNAFIKYKNGSDIWRNSGRVHNYEGNPLASGHTVSIHSGTVTISGSQTIQFGITKYSGVSCVGEFTVSGSTAPSGASVTFNSATYNSINITSKVNSWGSGYSGTPNLEQIVIAGTATSSNWQSTGRQAKSNATTSTTSTQSVTTANSTAYSGGVTIKGAMDFKVAAWASTSAGSTYAYSDTLHYTPPAPLQTLSYSQTQQSTNVKVDVSITGGSSTDNYGNTVTTYWRYSTNGGSSWSDWGNAGTGTPWTTKTASFTCDYGASIKIQAKQQYQGLDSAVKEVSFTATNGTAPTAGDVTITGSTWNSVTLQASGVNYGKPDGISGRKLAIGVRIGPNDSSYKRENQVENVTSATTTVTNSSIYPSAQPLQLKGMLPVYSYLWVWNTKTSATTSASTTPYYLPPAPGQLSYALDSETVAQKTFTVSYVGVAANNVTDYTATDLKRTVRYSEDNGSTWTYVDNDVQKSLTTTTSFQITVAAQHSVIVQSWLSYKGKDSDVSAVVISNNADPIYFYGSVSERDPVTGEFSDPESRLITKFYGSVNDETVKITKLYGSVNGVAREFFEDV